MPMSAQPYRVYGEGQIALELALFCLDCELIFAGTEHCPRCADEAVWPLNQWLPSMRPAAAMYPPQRTGLPDGSAKMVYLERNFSNR
jgi:hypothetical protein